VQIFNFVQFGPSYTHGRTERCLRLATGVIYLTCCSVCKLRLEWNASSSRDTVLATLIQGQDKTVTTLICLDLEPTWAHDQWYQHHADGGWVYWQEKSVHLKTRGKSINIRRVINMLEKEKKQPGDHDLKFQSMLEETVIMMLSKMQNKKKATLSLPL
jgi:hypothetical protein